LKPKRPRLTMYWGFKILKGILKSSDGWTSWNNQKKKKNIFLWFSIEFFGLIFASFQLFHKAKGKVPMVSTIPNLGKCQYILIVRPFCKIHITIMQVHKVIMHIHMNILQTHMCWFAWDIIKQKKPKFKLCLFFILICTPFMQLIPFKFEYYLPNHSTWH
jgi:hypothetical protein